MPILISPRATCASGLVDAYVHPGAMHAFLLNYVFLVRDNCSENFNRTSTTHTRQVYICNSLLLVHIAKSSLSTRTFISCWRCSFSVSNDAFIHPNSSTLNVSILWSRGFASTILSNILCLLIACLPSHCQTESVFLLLWLLDLPRTGLLSVGLCLCFHPFINKV